MTIIDPSAYRWVGIGEQISEQVQESLILHQLWVDIVELGDAHGGRLPHVGILVLQAFPQRLAQVLRDLVHADTAHGAHSKGSDQRVRVLTILEKKQDIVWYWNAYI